MEITLKIVLSADQNFLSALHALAGKTVMHSASIFDNSETPAVNGEEEKTKNKTRKVKETAAVVNMPATESGNSTAVQTTHTIDSLRAIAVPLSKAGHKDAIKTKLSEMGYPGGLSTLEAKDFQAFHDYLQTLN